MTRLASWLLLIILFSAFGAVADHAVRLCVDAGKGMPEYSVYSKERNGLATAAEFLRNAGWEPVALTRPIQQTRYRGLLVLVQPQGHELLPGLGGDLSEPDARGLLRWVEQGNTLLVCGHGMSTLYEQLGIRLRRSRVVGRDESTTRAEPGEAGGYTDQIDQVFVEGHDTLHTDIGLPLWWLDEQPGAVLVRRGQGRVIVVADASILTNRGLRRGDNQVFFHDLVALHVPRGGKVYFDEYHHGLHSGGGFGGYLRYHEQGWAVLPVLFVVATAVWGLAIRLGPAVPTPGPRSADAVEYASALARIYEKAGVRDLLGRVLVSGFRAALARHLRLRRTAVPAEILAAWRRQHPTQATARLEQLLRGASELRRGDGPLRRLLGWAEAFDRFQNEVLCAHRK